MRIRNALCIASLAILVSACSSPQDSAPQPGDPDQAAAQSPEERAAALAVKVANGKATPEEAAELDAYMRGEKQAP